MQSDLHSTDDMPTQVGPYQIVCELGRGSMATVYLARSVGPEGEPRLTALKIIHRHLSEQEEFVDLFLSEARITARIRHPNVIAVHDVSMFEGRYYLEMDYVSGETLFQALNRTWNEGRPFPVDVAARVALDVCKGLQAAHQLSDESGRPLGIIHRDIGPQNLLLGYDGGVRIMDFGVAKAMDRLTATQPGTFRGTVPFMAPEQIRAETVDHRADLFSLGVVLWETVVGQRLFKHKTLAGTMARVLGLEAPPPSALRRECSAGLEKIILRALEKSPTRRYPDAKAMALDLEAYLDALEAPESVGGFMRELFIDRHAQRLELEHEAMLDLMPGALPDLPRELPTQVMSLVSVADEDFLEDPQIAQWVADATGVRSLIEDPMPTVKAKIPLGSAAAPAPEEPDHQAVTEITSTPALPPNDAIFVEEKTVDGRLRGSTEKLAPAEIREAVSSRARSSGLMHPITRPEIVVQNASNGRWFVLGAMVLLIAAVVAVVAISSSGPDEAVLIQNPDLPKVRLTFEVEPADADLLIDGETHLGDLVVPLSPQQYTVEASAQGYQTKTVVVSAEASRSISIELEKVKKKKRPRRRRRSRRR